MSLSLTSDQEKINENLTIPCYNDRCSAVIWLTTVGSQNSNTEQTKIKEGLDENKADKGLDENKADEGGLAEINFETRCLSVHYMDSVASVASFCQWLTLAATCLMLATKFMYEPEDNPLCMSRLQLALFTETGTKVTLPMLRRMERAVLKHLNFALWQPGWTPFEAARCMRHCLQLSVSESARLIEWFQMWLIVKPSLREYGTLEVACAGVWTAMRDHCWPIVAETAARLFHTGVSRICALDCAVKVVLAFNPDPSCSATDLRSTM